MYYWSQIFIGELQCISTIFFQILSLPSFSLLSLSCVPPSRSSRLFLHTFHLFASLGFILCFFFSSSYFLLLLLWARLTAHKTQAALKLWSYSFYLWTDRIYRHVPPAPLSHLDLHTPPFSTLVGKLLFSSDTAFNFGNYFSCTDILLCSFFSSVRPSFKVSCVLYVVSIDIYN